MVEGQEYEQGHYEEHYDDSQQAEYQEYQVFEIKLTFLYFVSFVQEEHITDQHHHQDRHSPQQHHHQVHKDHYQQDYQVKMVIFSKILNISTKRHTTSKPTKPTIKTMKNTIRKRAMSNIMNR